ncbi:MAG: hypothetical protein O7A98_08290 [Acidobacteria bacterium]|nr:hypothetical protein [Acidobacteriota bacterium]
MKRLAALGLVAVVFLVGLAAGVLSARLLHYSGPLGDKRGGAPPFRAYFMQRHLELEVEQQKRLEEVLERQREKFEQLHRDLRPRVDSLMEETQAEIEQILTPEQLERYRARNRRWHRRPQNFGPRGRRRPDSDHRPRARDLPPPPPPPQPPPPPPPREDG